MKLFSEKVEFTSTDSSFNIIQVRDYNEIFFGVYEIEINKAKYPVEKISEHNGKPVVSVPVEVGGKKRYYPFVLSKGKQEILFNESNDEDSFEVEVKVIEEGIEENITIIEEIEDDAVPEISENTEILDQIKRAKSNAKKQLERIKRENLKNIREDFNKKETLLEKTLDDARDSLVSEFIGISNKIKDEILGENDGRYDEIKITLDNKIEELSESLKSEIDNNFDKSSEYLDKNLRKLVSESIKSINKNVDGKIGKSIENLSVQIDEKVDNSLGVFTKANVELNDRLNKGVNKALSRVGNIDKKVDSLDVNIEERIALAESNIKTFYEDKIKTLEEKTFDITEETRQLLVEMVRESRDGLLKEFIEVKGLNPIEYVIEDTNGKREVINQDKIIKDLEKKIDSEVTRMRRYVNVYGGGGGTVAMQFADGGTMEGDLTVVGSISASEYLGLEIPSGDYLPLSGGIVDGDLVITGSLSSTDLTNHIGDTNNPHEVNKNQVGLGNVDDTSDIDKPISNLTQSALDLKVDESELSSLVPYTGATSDVTLGSFSLFANSANLSGGLLVGDNTLFVDDTTGRVGIGTLTPSNPLDVAGNAAVSGYLLSFGGVYFQNINVRISRASNRMVLRGYSGFGFETHDGIGISERISVSPEGDMDMLGSLTLSKPLDLLSHNPKEAITYEALEWHTGWRHVSLLNSRTLHITVNSANVPTVGNVMQMVTRTNGPIESAQGIGIGSTNNASVLMGATTGTSRMPFGDRIRMAFTADIYSMKGDATFWFWIGYLASSQDSQLPNTTGGFGLRLSVNPTTENVDITPVIHDGVEFIYGVTVENAMGLDHVDRCRRLMVDIQNGVMDVYMNWDKITSISGGLSVDNTQNRFIAFYVHSFLSDGTVDNYARFRVGDVEYKA